MLEDYGVTTSLVPMGGWRYEQPHKDGIQRIPATGTAKDQHDLISQVTDFRVTHNISTDFIEWDIAIFILTVSGINNRYPKRPFPPKPDMPTFTPLIRRIRAWLDAMCARKVRLVSQHEASERANICLLCKHNVKWRVKDCDPCNAEVEARGQNLRRVAVFKPGDCLGACHLHVIHLPSAIFLDRDYLPLAKEGRPDNCWLPNEPTG